YYRDDKASATKPRSIRASYTASGWEAKSSISFPSTFSLTVFNRGTSEPAIKISGAVELVETNLTTPALPDLGCTNIVFQDDRFYADRALRTSLQYRSSNLLDMEAVRQSTAYKNAVTANELRRRRSVRGDWAFPGP